jgi:hypothetical protein
MAFREPGFDNYPLPCELDSVVGGRASIGELFGRLSDDAQRLIRDEMALAKAELRETGTALAGDGKQLSIAAGITLMGALALTAFLILALGDLLDNYWLSALIVSVLYLGTAAILGRRALADIKRRSMKPQKTIETSRNDVNWAQEQAREVKRELTS